MFVQPLLYLRTLGPDYSKFLVELPHVSGWAITKRPLDGKSLSKLSELNYLVPEGPYHKYHSKKRKPPELAQPADVMEDKRQPNATTDEIVAAMSTAALESITLPAGEVEEFP